jgi:glycosyltransferase 2 family protein
MSRWWLRAFQVLVLALVAWGVYRLLAPDLARLNRADLIRYRPAITPLIVSTLIMVGVNLLHAFIWRAIAVALTGATFSIRAAMRVFFISSLGRYIPGKVWQLAGMAVLAQREGFSAVAAAAASLVAQLAFLTTGILFLAVLLPGVLAGKTALITIGLLLLAAALFVFAATETGKAARHRVLNKLGPRIAQAAALLDNLTPRHALRFCGLYAVGWLLIGFAFVIFVRAFVPESPDVLMFAAIVAASYIGGYVSLLPAGVGAREGVMTALLTPTIGAPAALVISVLSRLWFTAGELLPLLALPFLPRGREV